MNAYNALDIKINLKNIAFVFLDLILEGVSNDVLSRRNWAIFVLIYGRMIENVV